MARLRYDPKGRSLRKGERYRKDGRYEYIYKDFYGKPQSIYAQTLVELRNKEDKVNKDNLDGIHEYKEGKSTLDFLFERYMKTKATLRLNTKNNYIYLYNTYIKDTLGSHRVSDIQYSDILTFYSSYLFETLKLSIATISSIHCILHPVFNLAVKDDVIRKNPTDGAFKSFKGNHKNDNTLSKVLTKQEQDIFLSYVSTSPVFYHYYPLFATLIATGLRISECAALTWDDIDFKAKEIHISKSLVYDKLENGKFGFTFSPGKTVAARRTLTMMPSTAEALLLEKEFCEARGYCQAEVEGVKGFVFQTRFGEPIKDGAINRALKRIVTTYNSEEVLNAEKEERQEVLLPNSLSCHWFRHTCCTRLCEMNISPVFIKNYLGHENVETSWNIYCHVMHQLESSYGLDENTDIID